MEKKWNSKIGKITRRDFIRGISAVAVTAALGIDLRAEEEKKARVVLVRDENALDKDGKPVAEVIQNMLDKGMCRLFNVAKPVEAWKQILKPGDKVGIKSNEWFYLPTPAEVEAAIMKRIMEVGVPEKNIVADDRGARTTLANCTVLVNARPLRTHHWSGIGGCIKNPIMFAATPWTYHGDMCADLARIWKLPIIKDKIKLNILVALTPQFFTRGAHHFDTRFVWQYKGIFLSQDPVAADAVGVKLLEAQRRIYFGEERPLTELARHVRIADQKHRLGISDLKKIELIKLGWDKDTLL